VHDNVRSFSPKDWERVVAVFVSGFEFQFKDWPEHNKMVELFLRVRGYFLHY